MTSRLVSFLEGRRVLVTGGTGSLGSVLVQRLLRGDAGSPRQIIVFSRDEAKQHEMRLRFRQAAVATDEVIYRNFNDLVSFRIGDVRDFASLRSAMRNADVVFNAAALKQVPTCEYFPVEAVRTNILGAANIVQAAQDLGTVELVVGISTDKACKPINVMGMTKALQERVFVEANLTSEPTRFVCVRYGNVIASRGSVVPLFREQIRRGGPVTITDPRMTRFLLSLDRAVDTVLTAGREARPGETWIPKLPSALVVDLARALMNGREVPIEHTGIRPGEKVHEILVSEEECFRTVERGEYYAILSMLPELQPAITEPRPLAGEYSSEEASIDAGGLQDLLASYLSPDGLSRLSMVY